MAKNGRWVMIAFLVLIALPLAAIAQNATQTVDLGDGYTITVPAGWEPDLSDETIFVFYGDTLVLGLNTPTMLTTMGWDNPGDFVDVVDALVNLANTADGSSLTRNDTRKAQFDGRSAATYAGPLDDTTDGLQVTLEMSDGAIGYLVFLGTTADLDASRDEMDAISHHSMWRKPRRPVPPGAAAVAPFARAAPTAASYGWVRARIAAPSPSCPPIPM
jgi:hypothetical protein